MANRASAQQQLGSIQQFKLQLLQSLPKQAFYSGSGSLLSNATQVLQQLREAIAARGIVASLPTTASSFNTATAQKLLELGE